MTVRVFTIVTGSIVGIITCALACRSQAAALVGVDLPKLLRRANSTLTKA